MTRKSVSLPEDTYRLGRTGIISGGRCASHARQGRANMKRLLAIAVAVTAYGVVVLAQGSAVFAGRTWV